MFNKFAKTYYSVGKSSRKNLLILINFKKVSKVTKKLQNKNNNYVASFRSYVIQKFTNNFFSKINKHKKEKIFIKLVFTPQRKISVNLKDQY